MLEMYRGGKGSLDYCADAAECRSGGVTVPAGPVVGVNVPVSLILQQLSINGRYLNVERDDQSMMP